MKKRLVTLLLLLSLSHEALAITRWAPCSEDPGWFSVAHGQHEHCDWYNSNLKYCWEKSPRETNAAGLCKCECARRPKNSALAIDSSSYCARSGSNCQTCWSGIAQDLDDCESNSSAGEAFSCVLGKLAEFRDCVDGTDPTPPSSSHGVPTSSGVGSTADFDAE
ncbi:MAG: hypothetical protein KDD70_11300 [Bdellovibrionales bacterium]|nr:hypothetical protein [Bdellovibrionales bacterium]